MGDNRGGFGPNPGSNSRGTSGGGQSSIENLIGILMTFMQHQRFSVSGQ